MPSQQAPAPRAPSLRLRAIPPCAFGQQSNFLSAPARARESFLGMDWGVRFPVKIQDSHAPAACAWFSRHKRRKLGHILRLFRLLGPPGLTLEKSAIQGIYSAISSTVLLCFIDTEHKALMPGVKLGRWYRTGSLE